MKKGARVLTKIRKCYDPNGLFLQNNKWSKCGYVCITPSD